MASHNTHYKVYLGAYEGIQGDHHVVYVDSEPNLERGPTGGSMGHIFHVQGNILNGMHFERRQVKHNPLFSPLGISMLPLGWILHDNFLQRTEEVCQRIPPPHKQYTLGKPIYPNISIRHCQHWASDAVHALCAAGVLEPLALSDDRATLYPPRS